MTASWEHFSHRADIGLRAVADTRAEVFEAIACAMTATVSDLDTIEPLLEVRIECEAPSDDLLLVDWLNALIYEMATRRLLFSDYKVELSDHRLIGLARGESVDRQKHQPAVEIKGATFTALEFGKLESGQWQAQCVIDV